MTCYHPIKAYRTRSGVCFTQLKREAEILGDIELPCGMCIGCRMRRASDWSMRVMHEASLWEENCFVTLTYARDCLPPGGSLCHEDFQKFMKRLRKRVGRPVRFYMCGEYGPETQRPHYHACLFNVDFRDRASAGKSGSGSLFYESKVLSQLWPHGFATVQDLIPETASYCARYIMKKVLGDGAEVHYGERRPDYAAMSLKPGIGAGWFAKYNGTDVFPQDFVVNDGVERPVPKYYDKLKARAGKGEFLGVDGHWYKYDDLDVFRMRRAVDAHTEVAQAENSTDRRRVREEVHLAKVSTLKRDF